MAIFKHCFRDYLPTVEEAVGGFIKYCYFFRLFFELETLEIFLLLTRTSCDKVSKFELNTLNKSKDNVFISK